MHRTVAFGYAGDAAWGFDEKGEPVTPGGRELAHRIASALAERGCLVSGVEQHEDYGWSFTCQHLGRRYYLVLNAVEPDIFLTVTLERSPWQWRDFFSGRPQASFDEYCALLSASLGNLAGVGGVAWEAYGR